MNGWIKLYRKIRENPIYDKPVGLKIWIECLISATHEDFLIDYGGKEKTLKTGEFVFGRFEWGKRLRLNHNTVYKWIRKLNERGMIKAQVREQGKATIYKIEKWDEYQEREQVEEQVGRQVGRQVRNRLVGTNKNNKNIRTKENIYNTVKSLDENDFQEIAESYKVPIALVRSSYDDLVNYCQSKGKRYKNYKAALRNFVKGNAIKTLKEDHDKRQSKSVISYYKE